MVGVFRANNPINSFLLFLYGFFLKIAIFSLHPEPLINAGDGPLYKTVVAQLQVLASGSTLIYVLISYILLYFQAVSLNRIINNQRMMPRTNYLPGMSYLLITSLFVEWNILSTPLIINSILIFTLSKMMSLHNDLSPKATLFNIGMLIGVATFLYFPVIAFAFIVMVALIFLRPFKLSEWIMTLLGILMPFYLLFAWSYLSGDSSFYKFHFQKFQLPHFTLNYVKSAAIAVTLFSFIYGATLLRLNMMKQIVQVRKNWSLLLFYLPVAFVIPFINNNSNFEYWIMTAVPIAAFTGCAFFYTTKRWIGLLLHWLMVSIVVTVSILYK
ncbi:MAG: DUF6427 family protein [Ginsengibacter sp.]